MIFFLQHSRNKPTATQEPASGVTTSRCSRMPPLTEEEGKNMRAVAAVVVDCGPRTPTLLHLADERERNKQADPCILKNTWLLVYLLLMTFPFAAGRKG